MPQVFIPTVGTLLELEQDWHFTLHEESRNQSLINMIDPKHGRTSWNQTSKTWKVMIPAGFEIKVTRIYIRQNQPSYDSITFQCLYNGKRVRFWVKLKDANTMVAKVIEPT